MAGTVFPSRGRAQASRQGDPTARAGRISRARQNGPTSADKHPDSHHPPPSPHHDCHRRATPTAAELPDGQPTHAIPMRREGGTHLHRGSSAGAGSTGSVPSSWDCGLPTGRRITGAVAMDLRAPLVTGLVTNCPGLGRTEATADGFDSTHSRSDRPVTDSVGPSRTGALGVQVPPRTQQRP